MYEDVSMLCSGAYLLTFPSPRFQWVVCQIDALQRLKPGINVVTTALANLPRTLDEIYERIFRQISEEAQDTVRYIFMWIRRHQLQHTFTGTQEQSNISCPVLLCVIQESLGLNGLNDSLAYAVDEELTKKFCGCFITISMEERHTKFGESSPGKRPPVRLLTDSFAHYIVFEFFGLSQNFKTAQNTHLLVCS